MSSRGFGMIVAVCFAGPAIGFLPPVDVAVAAAGDRKKDAKKVDPKQAIAKLIRELGDKSYKVRENAGKKLIEIGLPALEALEKASQSKVPEVRFRAGILVRKIRAGAKTLMLSRLLENIDKGEVVSPTNAGRMTEAVSLGETNWKADWTPKGDGLALLRWKQPIRLRWNKSAGKKYTSIATKAINVTFHPTKAIVVYNENNTVFVFDPVKKKTLHVMKTGRQTKATFSPNGKLMATGDYSREARIWTFPEMKLLHVLPMPGKEGAMRPVFSPDGKLIAVGNRNDETALFDVATGKRLRMFPRRMTQEIAFSPDGKFLAAGYVDGQIAVWNVKTGLRVHLFKSRCREVFTLSWSKDGKVLASAGNMGPIGLWHITPKKVKLLKELPAAGRVFAVRFRPDGRTLLSAGNQATMLWWVPSKRK